MADFNPYNKLITHLSPQGEQYGIHITAPSDFAKKNLFFAVSKGEICARFPFSLKIASASCYLILSTLEGEGKIICGDREYLLRPEKVIFLDCNLPMKLQLNKSSTWKFHYFLIDGNSIAAYYELYHRNNYTICSLSPVSRFNKISDKLIHHTNTSVQNELISSKLITDLLTELIISKTAELDNAASLPKYLLHIKELFDNHYKEHFNLDELADTYHISKYKIIRDFSTYLNISPINYLIARRIEAAQKLLKETDYPVYEIAAMVGIDNINHFTNLFKRATHLTPAAYRKHSHYTTPDL